MPEVHIDREKNRLYIILKGVITSEHGNDVKNLLAEKVQALNPGFGVVTDLTAAEIGYLSVLPTMKAMMAILVEHQVGTVVRVVEKRSTLMQQLSNAAAMMGHYQPQYVATLEEAEALLDSQD